MPCLQFEGHAKGVIEKVGVDIRDLVIAGWTGRDVIALNHHIEELKAIGVQPPSRVPIYYRASAQMLTQGDRIQVLGDDSSGEVEPVLIGAADRLWVTVGSDHTDRKLESYGIAVSKQMCAKPIARKAWRFEEVETHWDQLILRSFIQDGAPGGFRRVLYQEGRLGSIRDPRELIFGWKDEKRLPMGTALFCGTMPAIGAIRPSLQFEVELDDPVLGRKIVHSYEVDVLPILS